MIDAEVPTAGAFFVSDDNSAARRSVPGSEVERLVAMLRDQSLAESPATYPAARPAPQVPGLYSWWCDVEGRHTLSGRLGHTLPPPIYAGPAGATKWPSGRVGSATLYSPTRQMPL